MVRLIFCDHLGGQTGETHERGIFVPNQCAITYNFGGGPRIRACCTLKIDPSMLGRLVIIPVWFVSIFVAICVDK